MKKLILSLALVSFAIAVQAGDDKACAEKGKSACCTQKTKMQTDAGCCSMTKATACKATANTQVKLALMSPKAAEQVRR